MTQETYTCTFYCATAVPEWVKHTSTWEATEIKGLEQLTYPSFE